MVTKRQLTTVPTDTTNPSEDLQAISDRNSTESPLLNLQPEIRNRIFLYALGNSTIHLWTDPKTHQQRYTVCSAKKCTEGLLEHVTKAKRPFYSTFRKYSYPCNDKEPIRLPLQLLQTCRQVYEEAALIPFSTNRFQVGDEAFREFAYRIMAFQKRAIKSLSLLLGLAWGSIEKHVAMGFRNLQELKVVVLHGIQPQTHRGKIECFAGLPLLEFSMREFRARIGEVQSNDHVAIRSYLLEKWHTDRKVKHAKQQKEKLMAQSFKEKYETLKKKDDEGLRRAVSDGGEGSARALRRLKRKRGDDDGS
ncbi:hypothetical protein M409DRAFT_27498 [Zasmidium cellare ATCC 36951]|uniref:DUF7730 domain-containing protein n=1 Tax=Zasmidium cellare ATCC 36951 TaxID=1080233 RepID=A0A6A6C788_ZASCE|nr:uncharacterized protein M409DRAFT_27498 [Zasmidium cellare ATCC 36951]KAF2162118.1 hypothetical protein M409DRAFT_27498 [Zasmidium cellare ATCC 36951]